MENEVSHLCRKFVVRQALGRGPFNGEFGARVRRVSIVPHQTSQSEIRDFHQMIFTHETIPRCQIPEMIEWNID